MVFEIVGREAELASLNAFIDETEGGAAALVLEGEAGVGKSTLWGAAVERAASEMWGWEISSRGSSTTCWLHY
jgi:predicted ATPase